MKKEPALFPELRLVKFPESPWYLPKQCDLTQEKDALSTTAHSRWMVLLCPVSEVVSTSSPPLKEHAETANSMLHLAKMTDCL